MQKQRDAVVPRHAIRALVLAGALVVGATVGRTSAAFTATARDWRGNLGGGCAEYGWSAAAYLRWRNLDQHRPWRNVYADGDRVEPVNRHHTV